MICDLFVEVTNERKGSVGLWAWPEDAWVDELEWAGLERVWH